MRTVFALFVMVAIACSVSMVDACNVPYVAPGNSWIPNEYCLQTVNGVKSKLGAYCLNQKTRCSCWGNCGYLCKPDTLVCMERTTTTGPDPNPPGPDAAGLALFQAAILTATNQKRAIECASPVAQDGALTTIAQAYAAQLAATSSFQHSPPALAGQYGENLAMQCGPGAPFTGPQAVQLWYDEKQFFNPANPQIVISGNVNGHYTALVWKATTQMGCGLAKDPTGTCTYVVCNYLQPGNNPAVVAQNVGCP